MDEKKSDVIFIPWRDINNIRKEGFRVREGNIINSLNNREDVGKLLVVNRAVNFKNKLKKAKSGMEVENVYWPNQELVTKIWGSRIYRIKDDFYSIEMPAFFVNKGNNELESLFPIQLYLSSVIKKAAKYLNIQINSRKTLLISSDLTRDYLFRYFKKYNCKKIFDTIDNLTLHKSFSNKVRKKNKERYNVIAKNTDIIISVSKSNMELFKNNNNPKLVLENGVSINRFMQNKNKKQIKNKGGPIICGYVGVIESRIDFSLIKQLAIELPHIEFQFIGPILGQQDMKNHGLSENNNLKFLGPKSYDEIPNVIAGFDVCMIPHSINSFTLSMSPLKFYEYLAADKPIIMSNVPPASTVGNIDGVYVCNDKNDWVNALKDINKTNSNDYDFANRKRILDENSWDSVVKRLIEFINSTY